MVAEISYFEAWVHWLHGVDVDGDYMGGLTIKTWGRMGKIASALSGCVIVLDIIGPGRILRWGRRRGDAAQQRLDIAKARWAMLTDSTGPLWLAGVGYMRSGSKLGRWSRIRMNSSAARRPNGRLALDRKVSALRTEHDAYRDELTAVTGKGVPSVLDHLEVLVILGVIVTFYWAASLPRRDPAWVVFSLVGFAIALVYALPVVLPTALVAVRLVVPAITVGFYRFVVYPVGAVLRKRELVRYIRVASLILLIAGAQFDVLAG